MYFLFDIICKLLGWGLISVGMFVIISGIVALFRFPDFFTKMHASSVIECCGIPLSLFGLAFLQTSITSSFKLLLIAVIIYIINPVSSHALARAAMKEKVDPKGRIK